MEYIFKKGYKTQLDEIYHIQGILPQDTWEFIPLEDHDGLSDDIVFLKDVTVKIKITVK